MPKLTYANVISTLALFVALGGVGYAATKLPKNSVGAKQVKANAITGVKVKDQSLTAADFAGSIAGAQGAKGETGSTGPQGPEGPSTGPAGGDLQGNFPDPTIKDMAVGSDEIADDAVGLDELDQDAVRNGIIGSNQLDASVFARESETLAAPNLGGSIAAGTCVDRTVGSASLVVSTDDLVLLIPPTTYTQPLIFSPNLATSLANVSGKHVRICNPTAMAIVPNTAGLVFDLVVLRGA